ncbi:FecR family protein [Desertivirga xinjiangensis]|uniref:FecR family protein n=1 Tax=Desertivirga xinjiangensis TaxID=539206 RepID=UPI00210887D0|nr:FecR domain-containing protein [Pedobacter xinjiangensis]
MDRQRITFLLNRYLQNRITSDELDELSYYMHDVSAEPDLLDLIEEAGLAIPPAVRPAEEKDRLYDQIINAGGIHSSDLQRGRVIRPPFLKYAAAAVIILGLGLSFYLSKDAPLKNAKNTIAVDTKGDKIDMGSNRAILVLANGSRVLLDKDSSGTIARQGDYSITQEAGALYYQDTPAQSPEAIVYNTIATPKGSNYQVVLADGTRVWLNTNSSLTYPVAFTGAVREVQVTGEAYFEVARNEKKPFIVSTALSKVQVLGTHFNISAYPQAKAITTLLEGSVKVSAAAREVVIRPDQEATVISDGKGIFVQDVDAADAIAWRNGYFLFRDQNIKEVMETIAQWYDIEVEYQGDMADKKIGGTIARFKNIGKLLKTIELTGVVHFKIEGRRVIVME